MAVWVLVILISSSTRYFVPGGRGSENLRSFNKVLPQLLNNPCLQRLNAFLLNLPRSPQTKKQGKLRQISGDYNLISRFAHTSSKNQREGGREGGTKFLWKTIVPSYCYGGGLTAGCSCCLESFSTSSVPAIVCVSADLVVVFKLLSSASICDT